MYAQKLHLSLSAAANYRMVSPKHYTRDVLQNEEGVSVNVFRHVFTHVFMILFVPYF